MKAGHHRPRVERQLRVEHTALDRELLEEELEAVTSVDIVDEENAFALDELELEDDICEEELVDL